jgi:hypothetical protein
MRFENESKHESSRLYLTDSDQLYLNGITERLTGSGLLAGLTFEPGTIVTEGHWMESGYGHSDRRVQLEAVKSLSGASARFRPAIFVHELGHNIFADSFFAWIGKLTGKHENLREARRVDRESGKYYPTPEEVKAWEDQRHALLEPVAERLGMDVEEFDMMMNWPSDARSSYEELFCDLLPSLFFKDPKSMKTALTKLTGKKPRHALRAFAGDHDPATWTDAEPHRALAPVRSYLGKSFFAKKLYRDRERSEKLLSTVFGIAAKEIFALQKGEWKFEVSLANQRFIEALKEELGDAGN